jgi:gliding motility-associated-like protein
LKWIASILFTFLIAVQSYGQEICDNAIDDDGDGLVDLNDTDCECSNLIDLSLIPNPSFEDTLCCPTAEAMLACADSWVQASGATSDYYHSCGLTELPFVGAIPPEFPLPGGGEGFIGLYNFLTAYREYAGVCTTTPLLAGVSYSLKLYSAYAFGAEDELDLKLYGSPSCTDLPWFGVNCPEGIGGWQLLSSEHVTYSMDGSWLSIVLTFTPPVNMNAIALGGPCGDIGDTDGSYFYFDELVLLESITMGMINETGGWCSGDLTLTAVTDDPGGTWQWYKEGIALIGETAASLNPVGYGEGNFSVIYTYVGGCKRIDYSSPAIPTADFDFNNVCFGEVTGFDNLSLLAGGEEIYLWDFGDGAITNVASPAHTYSSSGSYFVSLIVYSSDPSCNDTVTKEITVLEKPMADYTLTGSSVTYTGIDWIGCAKDSIFFEDLTTVVGAMSIASWDWNLGDGNTSTLQNPSHVYVMDGTYEVKLVVEAETGCVDSVSYELILTSITADFSTDTRCEGNLFSFNDGSFSSDGSLISSHKWNFGDESEMFEGTPATHLYDEAGDFLASLSIENGLGCKDSISKFVKVLENPSPNFYASENPTDYFNTQLTLTIIDVNNESFYTWEMPGGIPESSNEKPRVEVIYPTFIVATYEVKLIEQRSNGCADSIVHQINVMEDEMVFAPNAFTPNADPFNNDWGIYVEGFRTEEFLLSVYNRWGELIWETTNPSGRWDGTYTDGNLVQSGVYVWYLTARDQITDEKFEYIGFINVIR